LGKPPQEVESEGDKGWDFENNPDDKAHLFKEKRTQEKEVLGAYSLRKKNPTRTKVTKKKAKKEKEGPKNERLVEHRHPTKGSRTKGGRFPLYRTNGGQGPLKWGRESKKKKAWKPQEVEDSKKQVELASIRILPLTGPAKEKKKPKTKTRN